MHAGFDAGRPAVVACTGVESLYLWQKTRILPSCARWQHFAPGSKLAMAFYLPLALLDEEDKFLQQIADKGARSATAHPSLSFFTPNEILALASEAGLNNIETISAGDLAKRYFAGRTDGLSPASGEEFLVATI